MDDLISIRCLFFLIKLYLTFAVPIPKSNNQNRPWINPCKPNSQLKRHESCNRHAVFPDYNIDHLVKKTCIIQELVDDLLETLEKEVADKEIIRLLQAKQVNGFPIADSSYNQEDVDMYKYHFFQLSQSAVFLERIQLDETDEDFRFLLTDLFTENLHQMCEIHLAIATQNSLLPPPASRSIMPLEYLHLVTSYEHYQRNYTIVYQYKLLLQRHLDQYRQVKKKRWESHAE